MHKNFHLGYFLKERHVEKAFKLLEKQLNELSPLYNNMDFSLYRLEQLNTYQPQDFYSKYISYDSIFYFEDIFHSVTYHSIQRAYKIREFHYLSLPSLITYYAVGFYILELMNDSLEARMAFYKWHDMNIYYGGKLNYERPENCDIFYYDDYKKFLQRKEAVTTPLDGKVIVSISLDIKSFFYTIDHSILLDIIDRKSSQENKVKLNYNEDTKRSIATLLHFFQGRQVGLPVSNQNIISSFLSYIYLSELDEHVSSKYVISGGYKYLRYVDDFYLILQENENADEKGIRAKVFDIENDIAEYLMKDLKLSVSSEKSKRFKITDEKTQIAFLEVSNIDSPFETEMELYDIYSDSLLSIVIKNMSPREIFEKCISIIAVMRAKTTELGHITLDVKESAFLNYILIHKPCLEYSRSSEAGQLIEKFGIFEDLDSIDFLLIKPKVIFHLITVNKTYRQRLFEFLVRLLNSRESMLPKLTMVDKFYHQLRFLLAQAKTKEQEVLSKEFEEYQATLSKCLLAHMLIDNRDSYLNLLERTLSGRVMINNFKRVYSPVFLNTQGAMPLTQQIKMRRLAEINKSYSVSFNHMLNEFQNLFELVYFNGEQKTSLDIVGKMTEEGFSFSEISFVKDFFKRRNQNSISHTNDPEIGLWNVYNEEYIQYKGKVISLTEILWRKLPN